MNRNEFLKRMGLGTVAIAAGPSLLTSCMDHGMEGEAPNVEDGIFNNPLKIPQTISSTSTLSAQTAMDTLANAKQTPVLGYGNGLLGPTIRAQKGQNVNLNFTNKLSEHTNIHWHGLVIPATMDGHPDHMIMPNNSFNFQFPITQQAGTNWYHPHLHGLTGKQVTEGLAGMFIVESPEEKALNLPSGAYEIPLIIQDKRINTNGTIQYNPTMAEVMSGYMGETILVNGTNSPFLEVVSRFYRFRVLNGSTARIYNLVLSNGADFYVIGSDGGMLPQSESMKSLLLSPGERADVLVDFSGAKVGEMIYLENKQFSGMGDAQGVQGYKIMSFNVTNAEKDNFALPTALLPFTKLSGATKTRPFKLTMSMGNSREGMHQINGKVFDSDRIDEIVNLGSTEIWEFDNTDGDEAHPMHVHGVHFQILSRTGGRNTILPQESGWKDTVLVAPKEKVLVILKFEHKGKFVVHCHNLEHEDDGMMLNFEVI
ncbi:Multicopper oxidase with three cupredoxin domains (includes cell division protein FtsP and spore coat protein CotA) [Algoriphagus boritolerans DSM 17298 = JCM 18970]|uniref:Multicopper oxidase with three cupredoxin domains (Includes cell division protein FtsP and spore coat protein CotA) n=2 Tax=Algoriphagus TaxID=246875 RepID=A0A1H5UBA9_9BACT|nr:multicopper oxidase domain-containing protein [Algoriphagus sp.]SEF72320.1 Multicopper oxidase with three cupredoxin domains (includes cell division protein FtsP and spore coat protein CotA) [Algoriphagus boritolerans DSM 17298 = JCM 18970]